MAELYAVCRTDKLYATQVKAGMRSFKFYDNDELAPIENGNVVVLDGLLEGERELYKAAAPAGSETDIEKIVLACSPELMYDERKKKLSDFRNEAGDNVRGYQLHCEDIFSVTAKALDAEAEIEIGNYVHLQEGETKLSVDSTAAGSIGEVIDINVVGPYTYYAIQVHDAVAGA